MNMNDLLDMKFGDVIEQYYVLYSPECDYIFGIIHIDVLEEADWKYIIDENYSASINATSLLSWDAEELFDEEFLTMDKVDHIMDNLGVPKND